MTIDIQMNVQEQQAFAQIIDIYVKAVGLAGAENALHFMRKLRDAQAQTAASEE